MGGQQAILSLTLILGPVIAGLAFDHLGVPAPYWIGGLLAALALLVAAVALLARRPTRIIAKRIFSGWDAFRKPRKLGGR